MASLLLSSILASHVRGDGQVYTRAGDAPRPTKTPVNLDLQLADGSKASGIVLRASIAERRLDSSSSRGGAGMTGRMNIFQKYVQLDIRGLTELTKAQTVHVSYSALDGLVLTTGTDSVDVTGRWPTIFVETDGFEDETGTQVSTTSSATMITSRKTKHFKGEYSAIEITIVDSDKKTIYVASWPGEPLRTVDSVPRFHPRTFTATDGRKVTGRVVRVTGTTMTLDIDRKSFVIPVASLSEPDQDFLRSLSGPPATPVGAVKPVQHIPPRAAGSSRYQFVGGSVSWEEAKERAEAMGGHLATVTSAEEHEEVLRHLPRDCDAAWLGARLNPNGAWVWVTGEPWEYTAWARSEDGNRTEPSESGPGVLREEYLEFARPGYKAPGGWNDSGPRSFWSGERQGFVVEWNEP